MARSFTIFAWLWLALLTPTAALSQTGDAAVEAQIASQGYEVVFSETTWLGRLRVLAVRGDLLREVVIGPGTGEVLRDVVYEIPGLAAELAKARKGADGRRIVNLDIFGGEGVLAAGPQDPLAVNIGDPAGDPDHSSGDESNGVAGSTNN